MRGVLEDGRSLYSYLRRGPASVAFCKPALAKAAFAREKAASEIWWSDRPTQHPEPIRAMYP
jgi:hypothetical protein